ncbi:ParB/RepB/Spo0J family partition protein [Nonomuraea glycinis]|uniref:ParB/RepB/Spo0J family partition protein n=1 Tax=Nonomuraea glycinis TaxID=2047744 RepID=UPI0033AAA36E
MSERTVMVPIEALSGSYSPRLDGESVEHIRTLCESPLQLPPVLVHRQTMRVLDGVHRLRVAELRGESDILTRFFDGDARDAFVLAVKANVSHGLPLTLADRSAAAARIIDSHPEWSDRAIAEITALSAKTVGTLRGRATGDSPQLHSRVGRDGRVRPLDGRAGRLRAAEFLAENPEASLREIAQIAGVSTGTARDVRTRVRQNLHPLPASLRKAGSEERETKPPGERSGTGSGPESRLSESDKKTALQRLCQDPSMRYSATGRILLRLLDVSLPGGDSWNRLLDWLPEHVKPSVGRLARECARGWTEFADRAQG